MGFTDGNNSQDITIKVFNPCFTSDFDSATIPIYDNLDPEYYITKFSPTPFLVNMGNFETYEDTAS